MSWKILNLQKPYNDFWSSLNPKNLVVSMIFGMATVQFAIAVDSTLSLWAVLKCDEEKMVSISCRILGTSMLISSWTFCFHRQFLSDQRCQVKLRCQGNPMESLAWRLFHKFLEVVDGRYHKLYEFPVAADQQWRRAMIFGNRHNLGRDAWVFGRLYYKDSMIRMCYSPSSEWVECIQYVPS